MQPRHVAEQRDSGRHPDAEAAGDGDAHAVLVGLGLFLVARAVGGAAPSHAPDERRDAQQQRQQQLHPQPLAGQRSDAGEQARGGGRNDRDVVALRLRRDGVFVAALIDGELRFRRFAAEPFGAVEDEHGVPGAAVGRPDRPGAIVSRSEQRRTQPCKRHDHVDRAGRGQSRQAL